MGVEEQHTNTTTAPHPAPSPTFPSYPEMIMKAIDELNDKKGSNKSTISKHLESKYGTLPPAHSALLSHHLDKMRQMGQLIMVKNNYMKNDLNAPPRRGRGRPPKPKAPLPPGYIPPPPRPRGRPPKDRDPNSPPSLKSPTTVGSITGRKRGRPSKSGNVAAVTVAVPIAGSDGSVRRGRGRPPKARPVGVEMEG